MKDGSQKAHEFIASIPFMLVERRSANRGKPEMCPWTNREHQKRGKIKAERPRLSANALI